MGRVVQNTGLSDDARIDRVERLLSATYGRKAWHRHADPLSELVATILSQHTSDRNTAAAFSSLRRRFPTWEEVRDAEVLHVEDTIRSGGLGRIKAPRIQQVLGAVAEKFGRLSLDDLKTMETADALAFLLDLPGVGPKTAACVLLFSLGRPILPVHTHVHRVALRLGLLPEGTSAATAHGMLTTLVGDDRDRVYAFHMNAIAHGRKICRARIPICGSCPLQECCDFNIRSRGH